jgi:hypothetical protein
MVADDLGGISQSEDPLPRRTDGSSFSTAPSAVSSPSSDSSISPDSIRSPDSAVRQTGARMGDAQSGRVPLWNRLPRSIWLMSCTGLLHVALLPLAL